MKLPKAKWLLLQLPAIFIVSGLLVLANLHPQQAKADDAPLFSSGDGIPGSPYLISSCTDLQNIGLLPDATFRLVQDIDCSESASWNNNQGFEPIQDFSGNLDGAGHAIDQLTITQYMSRYAGPFANGTTGTIQDLTLDDAHITLDQSGLTMGPGDAMVGGVVAEALNSHSLRGVHFNGNIDVYPGTDCINTYAIGGLVGRARTEQDSQRLNIEEGATTGTITFHDTGCSTNLSRIGGLVGDTQEDTSIVASYSAVAINVDATAQTAPCGSSCQSVGGLVGYVSNQSSSSIEKSYSSGTITLAYPNENGPYPYLGYTVGGLIGYGASGIFAATNFAASPITVPPPCDDLTCSANARTTGGILGAGYYGIFGANYVDETTSGQSLCSGDSSPYVTCNFIQDPAYFKTAQWPFNWSYNTGYSPWTFVDGYYPQLEPISTYAQPQQLSIRDIAITSSTQVSVSWDLIGVPSNQTTAGFTVICKKTTEVSWSVCGTTDKPSTTSMSISGLDPGTQYNFLVVLQDSKGFYRQADDVATGTTGTPGFHIISTCQQLQDINQELDGSYELGNDIDCSNTVNWNNGAGFEPIGDFNFDGIPEAYMFSGIFAGNTYTINDLFTNQESTGNTVAALFGGTYNALIQDVKLVNPVTVGSESGIAASLAAFSYGTTITNTHVTNGAVTGGGIVLGGLVGYVHNEEVTPSVISYNEFNGAIQASGANYYVGGFSGLFAGATEAHDNFTHVDVSSEHAATTGGFAGYVLNDSHDYEGSPVLTNNYTSGTMSYTGEPSEGGDSVLGVGGGFIGMGQSEGSITNNFAHQAMSGFNHTGGFIGLTQNADDLPGTSNNYFDADQAGTTDCSQGISIPCQPINGQPNYFKSNSTNPPLDQWDFTNVWKITPEFPEFDSRVLTSITAIDPARLNPPLPEDGSDGGSVGNPANPTDAAIATQTLVAGAPTTSGPTDEHGLLGAIKHFVRSLPVIVVVGFPYAMFVLLGLAACALLVELFRELRRLHLLQILIHKQQLLAEERDAFWHLAANYLRAPVTLIVGGTEALNDVKTTTTTTSLSGVATSLQTKVAEIMKKIEGSTSLQSISQAAPRPVTRTAKRAVFIIPVVTVATLAILGNYAAASFRNMSPGAAGYLVQAAVFIIVAVIFYWTLGLLSRGKSKRRAAQAQLDRQTNELANARHELINDTAKNLDPDLTKLEELIAALPAKQAASAPAQTLQEGSSRLREIVTSFTLLIKVQEGTGQVAGTPKTIDLTNLLNRTRAKLTPQITAKGVRVTAPALPLAVHAEAEMANQVLESIISNAVDYSPANGTVKVEAQKLQDKIRLRISDQGKGIDKKQLDHLFRPFIRTDGTSAMDMSHGGFGINLYLDKLIMEQLGGSISATSKPGKGTAITMEWPV